MKFLTLFLAAPALATLSQPMLLKRQSDCSSAGYKSCGDGCIPLTWKCCPKEDGGCPATSYCDIGDNGETSCCLNGFQCTGDGGVSTDYNTLTSTIWSTVEEETSTTVEDTVTYSASLPILTLTSTTTTETASEETSVPPVDLPSPIPSGNETTTAEPSSVPTAAANGNGVAGNLVGGVVAGAAMLLI